jgi:hypothetical protein
MRLPNVPMTGLVMAVLAGCALPSIALADDGCKYRADRQASVETAGAERVEISARSGDLDVQPAKGTALVGTGRACASREEYLAKIQVHAAREGNVVRIWVEVPDELHGLGMTYATLDLNVAVPAGLPVSIVATSGDLHVTGLSVTKISDSSGDIVATGLLADVEIDDSSGDLRIEQTSGRVTVHDSSGDIVIHDARDVHVTGDSSGDIRIERISGDVVIDNDSSGDISIHDVGGNATVRADGSGDVQVANVKGTVSVPKN